MKVKQLIKELQKLDGDSIVIMAKDAEGNGYSPLADLWAGAYRATTTWYGDVGFEKLTPALKRQGYSELDIIDGKPAVILTPTN